LVVISIKSFPFSVVIKIKSLKSFEASVENPASQRGSVQKKNTMKITNRVRHFHFELKKRKRASSKRRQPS
jgi:hypothetical protein